ncbi:MAG: hypothetical protein A2148_00335 [Chloroflexi bacterium RBG_16_68_14]|nr:MAG: hypothetical protein A2148_00335 [Chloroflexi bacterium RBG_16_68_14]
MALLGEGDQAERWTSALRERADLRPLPQQLAGEIDALVLAPGVSDPFTRAKEALLARVSVLYAAPFTLNPWQAATLNELSRRQERLLRFVEPFQYRPGFAFLRRLLAGREPFWRPVYLRTLCLAQHDGLVRIDELATEELAICEALLDGEPRYVTAAAGRRDEVGDVCAAFLILQYSEGPLVQCTVSLAEATSARQVVAVTADRTMILDDLGPVASLRIVGGGEQDFSVEAPAAAPSGEGRGERMVAAAGHDFVVEEVNRFLSAVAAADRSPANGDRWARVAALWWAARQSMSFEEPIEVPRPVFGWAEAEPPRLRVIEGGGRTARTAGRRPPLAVVAR